MIGYVSRLSVNVSGLETKKVHLKTQTLDVKLPETQMSVIISKPDIAIKLVHQKQLLKSLWQLVNINTKANNWLFLSFFIYLSRQKAVVHRNGWLEKMQKSQAKANMPYWDHRKISRSVRGSTLTITVRLNISTVIANRPLFERPTTIPSTP